MKISTKGRYALRMMLDLAIHQNEGFVSLKDIADRQGISKKYLEQIRICNEVLHSCRHSKEIASLVKGFMIESYIEDGAQKIGEGVYGRSITDPCLGWEKSERLIYDIADQL